MTDTEREIYEAAREFKNSRFNVIPSVLFTNHKAMEDGEYDEVLSLVAGGRTCCSYCGEEVELDDDTDEWTCDNCETSGDRDELSMEGSPYAWPCAHSYMFWYDDGLDITEAAADAGFLVFESPDMSGVILGIDGGGYDFVEAHWVKLYNNLGLKWHESE